MNMNDWSHYIQPQGPGWYHLCVAIQDTDLLDMLLKYMWAISVFSMTPVDRDWMDRNRTRWLEALAAAERDLPEPEIQALINHSIIEIWEQMYQWGPSFTTWMYVFERLMASLTRKLTDRARPEASMMTNWVLADNVARTRQRVLDRLNREFNKNGKTSRTAKSVDRVKGHVAGTDHRRRKQVGCLPS